ncbi:MAG: protoporphyrinogen oxidase HemJ [Alphaproteobacteria bacterium]
MTTSVMMAPKDRLRRGLVGVATGVGLIVGAHVLAPVSASLWIKAFHVIAVISWMAGLLYLPRIFVYHCGVAVGSDASETFKVMEHKLMEYIMTPAMLVSWVLGLWLAYESFQFRGGWLHGKIALVFALSGAHGYFIGAVRKFGEDRNDRDHKHWRIWNEVPTLLMIVIVILVIVKPF